MTATERAAFAELHARVTAAIENGGDCPASFAIGMLINLAAQLIARSVTAERVETVTTEAVRVLRQRVAFHHESEQDWPASPHNMH